MPFDKNGFKVIGSPASAKVTLQGGTEPKERTRFPRLALDAISASVNQRFVIRPEKAGRILSINFSDDTVAKLITGLNRVASKAASAPYIRLENSPDIQIAKISNDEGSLGEYGNQVILEPNERCLVNIQNTLTGEEITMQCHRSKQSDSFGEAASKEARLYGLHWNDSDLPNGVSIEVSRANDKGSSKAA